jgi:coenzyme F420-reducing hydrogenase delta subunit/Pyruvate/2-oxoacid:ferredoxin oxidoreductase delta subunit
MFSDNEKATVVFLNGWHLQSHPAVAARMLQHCLSLQKQGAQTFFLTGNLKVAGKGLEDLYQQAKCHGAIFLKFDQDFPHVHQLPDGRAQFDCPDDAADMRLQITADWTIVDETHQPAAVLKPLGSWLAIERDPFGFLQADNVHRLVNFTNRRGIFAAGASRDWMSEASKLADAQHVALSVADFLQDHDRMDTPCAQIEQGKCARCLTCVRLCPYQAIAIESHITIKTEACQGCGICAAGCPARAIAMDRMDVDTSLVRATAASTPEPAENLEMPRLAVFCCSRSASAARRTAAEQGRQLKSDVFFIEGMCAGSFSARHLLYAFEAGMDGVMVLTCHENNCHSGSGRYRSELNVATAHKLLEPAGIESERLVFHSLAANMPAQLATVIGDFTQRIRSLSAVAHQLPGRPETG